MYVYSEAGLRVNMSCITKKIRWPLVINSSFVTCRQKSTTNREFEMHMKCGYYDSQHFIMNFSHKVELENNIEAVR